MGRPTGFTVVRDIPLSDTVVDIAIGIPGADISEPALVLIAMNGETVDIRAQVSIGTAQVLPESRVTVQATIGVLPVTPDDILVATLGSAGESITIKGTNLDSAAARELRAKVQIFPMSDIAALQLLMQQMRELGIPIVA
jgi:hypothetical protein